MTKSYLPGDISSAPPEWAEPAPTPEVEGPSPWFKPEPEPESWLKDFLKTVDVEWSEGWPDWAEDDYDFEDAYEEVTKEQERAPDIRGNPHESI